MPVEQAGQDTLALIIPQLWRVAVGVGAVLFTVTLLYFGAKLIRTQMGEDDWKDATRDKLHLVIGLPMAMVAAFGLVVFFDAISKETIEVRLWGLELKGPAAPLVMWVIVFLAIVLAIKTLYKR